MERIITYEITEADAGSDVHSFLRQKGYSRHILASMKPDPEAVLLNGTHVFMRHPLTAGDTLRIRLRDEESSETLIPAPVPFTIFYEDEDLLVIDKPVNEAIHPAVSHPADTLGNGLAYYFSQKNIPFVFRCINRLDRDTTGLLIVAKNLLAASVLEQSLQRREIHRTYLAAAAGLLPDEGTAPSLTTGRSGALRNGNGNRSREAVRFPDFPCCSCSWRPAAPTRSAFILRTSGTRSRVIPSTTRTASAATRSFRLPAPAYHRRTTIPSR